MGKQGRLWRMKGLRGGMHNSCFSIGKMAARSPAKETCARILNLVFANTCPKRSFSIIENECFGLVFAKTGSINSGIEKGHKACRLCAFLFKGVVSTHR